MATIDDRKLKQQLKDGETSNLYFVCGGEDYVKRLCIDMLVKKFAPDGESGFDFKKLNGSETSVGEIASACETLPWMSEYTFVLVTDFAFESLDDKEYELLKSVADDVPSSCVLVFWQLASPGAKANKQNGFIKYTEKRGTVVRCEVKTKPEIEKAVASGIKKRGCDISPKDLAYLVDCVGLDLYLLINEVEKLAAYRNGGTITREDIDLLCTKSVEAKAFDITDAIVAGRCEYALGILQKLFVLREDPYRILGAIVANYTDMYRVKIAILRDGNGEALTELYGCYKSHSFRIKKGARAASKLSVGRLRKALDELDRTDEIMKRTGTEPQQALEELIIRLAAI